MILQAIAMLLNILLSECGSEQCRQIDNLLNNATTSISYSNVKPVLPNFDETPLVYKEYTTFLQLNEQAILEHSIAAASFCLIHFTFTRNNNEKDYALDGNVGTTDDCTASYNRRYTDKL